MNTESMVERMGLSWVWGNLLSENLKKVEEIIEGRSKEIFGQESHNSMRENISLVFYRELKRGEGVEKYLRVCARKERIGLA